MGRNRFVKPEVVRLSLADVHRRAHQELIDRQSVKATATTPAVLAATPDEIAKSAARVKSAEADGDYIDIKKELNAGEGRRVFARIVKDMRAGEKVQIDPEQVGLTKIVEYLVGWSFVDADGRPEDVSEGAINALDAETYQEITKAIDAHEEKLEAERAERKNMTAGTQSTAAISASAV